jgi:hypothetical protein
MSNTRPGSVIFSTTQSQRIAPPVVLNEHSLWWYSGAVRRAIFQAVGKSMKPFAST